MTDFLSSFSGSLLGTAAGDSLGLPREGLSPRRALRLFGPAPLSQRLIFGRGMISDDTEHACMTAQALLASAGNPDAFARSLAWRLRGWLLALPAGIGLATLRAILKLWCGFPPHRSGVFSAGNGPAMRAPILGVWLAATNATPDQIHQLVSASTRLTHTDPKALEGALAITLATMHAARTGPANFTHQQLLPQILPLIHDSDLLHRLTQIPAHLARHASLQEFAISLNLTRGVTGYINHTVPIALYAALRSPTDFRRAIEDAILLGGDTDTLAAIIGGILGAANGPTAIPPDWLSNLRDFPRSVPWITQLATRLATAAQTNAPTKPLPLFWPALLLRNPLFALIVIFHGIRRLLPPY